MAREANAPWFTDDPIVPFTPVELEIALLAGKGYGHLRIAVILHRPSEGIRQSILRMARKLVTDDDIPPLTAVQLWGAHRIWLASHSRPSTGRDVA